MNFRLDISVRAKDIPVELGEVRYRRPVNIDVSKGHAEPIETYDGPYEVIPMANSEVTLATEGKKMKDDVLVLEVPYYETSNLSGGYTVYIGGEHV